MYKAPPVELRTSTDLAYDPVQIGVKFVPTLAKIDEESHMLATSLSQELEMMVTKVEVDERNQVW